MKFTLYLDDYETERTFSYMRWIFLFIAAFMFYYPPIDNILQFEHKTFNTLFVGSLLYMGLSQMIFQRMDSKQYLFPIAIKTAIVFDFISLLWLLVLTGGINSILFPISFLLVMHATIYWRTKGAFFTSFFISCGYIIIFIQESIVTEQQWFSFVMNLIFIWIVGLFGSLIVLRERKHFKQKEIFHELVVTDYLTGLNNHRLFQQHLRHLTEKDIPFVLVMGDIDHFKGINDGYGHLIGDDVLRSLGKIFTEIVSRYEGHAFRYGGEEFTFLLPVTSEQAIATFFDELYHQMNEKSFTCDKWTVTMSFGVATNRAGQTPNQILSIVDELLYEAKGNGKNCACFETGECYQNEKRPTMMAN